ncbi:uncharacterized protein TNCT_34571 [Trichonephila clavata]|uniref:Uncharacterized protein n=1 Tax=Trichonephila clavata TaxID=2740835 RepID=A0A8X6GD78_TRICU|nr:uncharacterized protein TNCT_34571 [Trichonephila clavata]
MTDEIKKQQTIDQQSFGSNIKDPMEFSRSDLSNKTDEHESDNRLQNSSDHDSDDSSADRRLTEPSDWDSNSSCSLDYSYFPEGGSLLMDLEIPLTENEEKLIDEFCVLESTTNTTSGGRSSRLDPIDLLDYSKDEDEATKDENISIIQSIVRDLLLKGGKVKRYLFHHDRIGHATTAFVDNSFLQFDKHLFAECKKIENDLKNVAYESIVNKNEQAQKDKLELKVEIDNECFCIKYPQDSTVEVAKILSNEKNKSLNLRVGILQIGKSIVRVESYNGKRNYLDVLKQGVILSFDSEAGKISIHLNPKKNSNEIEVKLDESSEEVFEKLKKSGLSLGENCLLGGKSVLEAIRDGNFERNRSIIPTSVIEQPNTATNTPRSHLENISLSGHNYKTKQ